VEDGPHFLRWISSYFQEQVLEERRTPHNPRLAVIEVNGRRRLDGLTVNYSHGSLERVLRGAFELAGVRERSVASLLMLGFGAGSAVRLLREEFGHAPRVTAVELDPAVLELARRWFGCVADEQLELVLADAAQWVRTARTQHELLLVDAFVDERVPETLLRPEFLADAARLVAPGGLLLFNTIADTLAHVATSERLEATAREVLGEVRRLEIEANRVLAWEQPREAQVFFFNPPDTAS